MVEDDNQTAAPVEPKFRRRKDARPDEILDAALQLFAENGFDRTRVDDVARHAGVSKGAVYLYFTSKEALIEALVDRAIGDTVGEITTALTTWQGDPRPLLRRVAAMLAMKFSDPAARALPKLVLHEAPSHPKLAKIYHQMVISRVVPAATALLTQAVEGGHIRRIDPEMATRCIIGPILAHLVLADIFGEVPKQGLDFQGLIDTHLTLLMAGLEPEKEPGDA